MIRVPKLVPERGIEISIVGDEVLVTAGVTYSATIADFPPDLADDPGLAALVRGIAAEEWLPGAEVNDLIAAAVFGIPDVSEHLRAEAERVLNEICAAIRAGRQEASDV